MIQILMVNIDYNLTYIDFEIPNHGDLSDWAKQGVFLLNVGLTVKAGKANTHKHIPWKFFTDHVIKVISKERKNVVFMLWGKPTEKKMALIDTKKVKIISILF